MIYNQSGSYSEGNYQSIEEVWDLQNYKIYTQKFENNQLVAVKSGFQIGEPFWESCMLENGVFEIGPDGNINANTSQLNSIAAYPPCGWVGGESGWSRFKRWFRGLFVSNADDDYNGDGSGGSTFPPYIPGGGGDWTTPGGGSSGGGPGGGTASNLGGDPYFNQPQTAPGFENGGDGSWMEISVEDPNDPIYVNAVTDSNGYIVSRKFAFEVYLQNNPYGAINCNDIDNLPMLFLQGLATFQPPQSVIDRMDSIINANSPIYDTNNTFVQKIIDGEGVVNLDFFPVKISQFPLNTNNQIMTPLEFLDFFRKNLSNSLFPVFGGNSFSPYIHFQNGMFYVNIDESVKYNSSFENSIGSWVHINIPIPGEGLPWPLSMFGDSVYRNNGSVVLSDYNIDNVNQHYWFTFTTMANVIDGTHPICGNRRFGIYYNPNGFWEFYTAGVDRAWDWTAVKLGDPSYGFQQADYLWTSVQYTILNYCNNNGGSAQIFPQENRKARFEWDSVKEFLLGNIDLQTLKNLLGCP